MATYLCSRPESTPVSRRSFLCGMGTSLGSVAFSHMLASEVAADERDRARHTSGPAKACIMLFMEGGPSHIDTFDPKPELDKLHMKKFVQRSKEISNASAGNRFYVRTPFRFKKTGRAGVEMNTLFEHISAADVADELCIYRGGQAMSVNHPAALYHMNTGSQFSGDPAIGAWVNYGLGSENENLPGYVVMTELSDPQGGSGNWSNGFLPAHYHGTRLRSSGSPILDLNRPDWRTREHQRKSLDVINVLNQNHLKNHPQHEALASRMKDYELAFRMQMEVPDVVDIGDEPESIRRMYGLDNIETASFGRQCLLARRLVESGVRFVQIFSSGWDSHDYLERAHTKRIRSVDRPIAALIRDLRQRGMLDETLVVWTGEFGRTPDNNVRGGDVAIGRDHNAEAMTMLFAGGGVKAGSVIGGTDEIGKTAVEVVHPIRDVHVTMLHLLGLDDNKLTYFHGGRYKQLSQFGGRVIKELVA